MNKIILILIGSTLLTGCGIVSETQKILNVHPEAQPYVARFEQISGRHIDNLEVVFRPISGSTIGYCQKSYETKYSSLGFKRTETEHNLIVIDSNYWNPNDSLDNYSEVPNQDGKTPRQIEAADREELMFHELGHCILNRGHVNSTASIMYPYHLGGVGYLNRYMSYISELFGFSSYAGTAIENDTYASKVFPEFIDRGDEIQVLSSEQLENGDFHEEHIETVEDDHYHDEESQDNQN